MFVYTKYNVYWTVFHLHYIASLPPWGHPYVCYWKIYFIKDAIKFHDKNYMNKSSVHSYLSFKLTLFHHTIWDWTLVQDRHWRRQSSQALRCCRRVTPSSLSHQTTVPMLSTPREGTLLHVLISTHTHLPSVGGDQSLAGDDWPRLRPPPEGPPPAALSRPSILQRPKWRSLVGWMLHERRDREMCWPPFCASFLQHFQKLSELSLNRSKTSLQFKYFPSRYFGIYNAQTGYFNPAAGPTQPRKAFIFSQQKTCIFKKLS